MSCLICKDENVDLCRICTCSDALLCNDCLKLSHNNIQICPLCRNNLKFNIQRDYYNFIFLILLEILIYLTIIVVPLIYPILLLLNNNNTSSIVLLLSSVYFVLCVDPINIKFIKKHINIDNMYLHLLKIVGIIVIYLPLLVMSTEYKINLYIIGILIPFFIIPNFIVSCSINYKLINNAIDYNNKKTLVKTIKYSNITQTVNIISINNL